MKIDSLHLDHAQALLARAGQSLPGPQGSEDPAYLQRLIDALCDLSLRDPLTGLSNRRHFLAALGDEIDAHQREQLTAYGLAEHRPLTVLQQKPMTVILADEVELALEHQIARHIWVER